MGLQVLSFLFLYIINAWNLIELSVRLIELECVAHSQRGWTSSTRCFRYFLPPEATSAKHLSFSVNSSDTVVILIRVHRCPLDSHPDSTTCSCLRLHLRVRHCEHEIRWVVLCGERLYLVPIRIKDKGRRFSISLGYPTHSTSMGRRRAIRMLVWPHNV